MIVSAGVRIRESIVLDGVHLHVSNNMFTYVSVKHIGLYFVMVSIL